MAAPIMREAADWLAQRGEALWDPADLTPEHLARRCQPEEVFVGEVAGVPAVCAIIQPRDFLWPDDGLGLIVHKLAVRRAYAGRGLAEAMLAFAAERAQAAGRSRLRLDCADRPRLRAFYERAGFQFVRHGKIGTLDVVLYEKAL